MKNISPIPIVVFVCALSLFAFVMFGSSGLFRGDSGSKPVAEDAPRVTENQSNEAEQLPVITEAPGDAPEGMVWIPGGTYMMGTPEKWGPREDEETGEVINPDKVKLDEIPAHKVTVDGFFMDVTEVTNAQFAEFVEATGYVTFAEKKPKREDFIGIVPDVSLIPEKNLVPGSIIFNEEIDKENLVTDVQGWEYQAWKMEPGADWRHPTGPDSSIEEKMDHPVVNVVYDDALAYCKWAGKRLPTEAEWEYACRGGKDGLKYAWGNELIPDGKYMCNYWQGEFPIDRPVLDGFKDSAPVKSYPPNGYGLYEMSGNVWEWVNDYYHRDYYEDSPERNPPGPEKWFDPTEHPAIEKRVTRGGSFMCNLNNCTGYRNAARMRSDVTSACFHTGFRCVVDSAMYENR